MTPLPAPPAMTDEEFGLFNELMVERFGLHFPEHKKEILESRLAPRLKVLQLHRFMDYYILLKFAGENPDEIERLASLVTNNESYFFRETHQFEALFAHALEDLKARAVSPGVIRILCAGCSSGEEPYTLNIFAKENQYRMWGWTVEVSAFDLDSDRVVLAKKASYGEGSLRTLDEAKRSKYFNAHGPDRWGLKPMYQQGVTFRRGNILDLETYPHPLPYEVVFCRNVLIYFEEAALRQAVSNFARCLRSGGLLFLGHSESIIGLTGLFEPVRLGDGIAYSRNPP